jgi:hypothetical protein
MDVFLKDVRKKTESLRESELLDLVNSNHSRIYFSTLKSLQPGRGLSASAWVKGFGSSGEGKDEGMEEDDDDDDNDEDEVEEDDGGGEDGNESAGEDMVDYDLDDIAGDDQVVVGGEMIRIADYLGEDWDLKIVSQLAAEQGPRSLAQC